MPSLSAMLLKPTLDISTHLAESTREDVKRDRLKMGLCPTCGYQIHKKVAMGLKRKPRTVPGRVLAGRCLLCDPDDDTVGSISSSSVISPKDETSFLQGKNVNPLDIARMRSINMDLQRLGEKYAEYGFGFAVSVPTTGKKENNNLAHVYPVAKSKKKMLFTLRPENFENRYVTMSAKELSMVVGNEFPSSKRIERPVTLADTLKNIHSYARMASLGEWVDLTSALDDSEVCVRFQTTFLPVSKKKSSNKTIEFTMESQSSFSDSTSDEARHSSNLMFLCTNQGTSVTHNEGKRRKQKLFHHIRQVNEKDSHMNRHWLQGEWTDRVGKKQQDEEKVCATRGLGMRFNVVMTVQVPLSDQSMTDIEKCPSMEDNALDNDQKESSSSDDDDVSFSEESENGWSSGEEDTYTDDSIDEDSEIWSEFDNLPSTALEQAVNKPSPHAIAKEETKQQQDQVMNLHTMVTSGMISTTDGIENKDDKSRSQTKTLEESEDPNSAPRQPLTPDTSHEDGLSCGEHSNGSAENTEESQKHLDGNSGHDEECVFVFGVSPMSKSKKKGLSRLGGALPAFQNLSQKWKESRKKSRLLDTKDQQFSGNVANQQDPSEIEKWINFCPEKGQKGKLKKGKLQSARVSVGSYKGKSRTLAQSKACRRHGSTIHVTITIIHGVVGGVPNKEGVKTAVDEMEDLYRHCECGPDGL